MLKMTRQYDDMNIGLVNARPTLPAGMNYSSRLGLYSMFCLNHSIRTIRKINVITSG